MEGEPVSEGEGEPSEGEGETTEGEGEGEGEDEAKERRILFCGGANDSSGNRIGDVTIMLLALLALVAHVAQHHFSRKETAEDFDE